MAAVQALCDTYDDDTTLEFYWTAASGNVDHYSVNLSAYSDPDDADNYIFAGTTPVAPTQTTPYAVPVTAEDGKWYRLKVWGVDGQGTPGPESLPSDLVRCRLRSPGDVTGSTPGDADGNWRVSAGDWAILCLSWNAQRGDSLFDYRADLNYDDSVNILDITAIGSSWGNDYDGAPSAPMPNLPIASVSRCNIKMAAQRNVKVGDEVFIDILIEEAKDIYAMDFEVSFDPGLVKIEQIERGSFFSNASIQTDALLPAETPASFSWIAGETDQNRGRISPTLTAVPLGSSAGKSGDGVIARLKLTAVSGGAFSISLKNVHAYDSKLNSIAASPTGVTFSIEAAKYRLAQNYPNPFNPETWIPYALEKECNKVTVIIYSALGEEIRRLNLGRRNAGFYTTKERAVYWDGRNEDGISVASGIYFYQISADKFSAVRKMVVLR
jgi:hypothetical protein